MTGELVPDPSDVDREAALVAGMVGRERDAAQLGTDTNTGPEGAATARCTARARTSGTDAAPVPELP